MQFNSFQQVIQQVKTLPRVRVSVANAQDQEVLLALKDAMAEGFVDPILVGEPAAMEQAARKVGFDLPGCRMITAQDEAQAAMLAAKVVHDGEAEVLMKGHINSATFLKAVLNADYGLRTGNILSHAAVYELPGFNRLIFMTDGGLNIAPDLNQKKQILQNMVDLCHFMGLNNPKAAVLAANEQVSLKMPVTVEAQKLAEMARQGLITGAVVEGPMALDVAVSPEAAAHKHIDTPVAGQADILLVPYIEAGNVLGKSIMYLAGGVMAGLVLGAKAPVVLSSRADTARGKLVSLAVACLAGQAMAGKEIERCAG